MKKLLFTILFAFSISVNAQYYSITFVNVPQENIAEFQMLETNYWSKVAKANIDAGKQLSWGLVARVGGGSDSWNHAFVNVYETAEQMTDLSIWDPKSSIQGEGTASIWNFGRPAAKNQFIDENVNLWGPAFKKNMGGRTSWGVGQKLNNLEEQYSTVMTWDGFSSVADALKFMNGEFGGSGVTNSNMGEIMPDGFTAQVIVQDVMWVQ